MKDAARFLIHLYPATWRERYGEEFQALLEDSAPSFSALVDLMKGAMKMQLSVPSFPRLALLLSVAGMLAGWGISFLVTPTYMSTATLQLTPKISDGTPQVLVERIREMEEEVLSRTSLSRIITDPQIDIYKEQRARQPFEDVIQTMRKQDVKMTIGDLPGRAPVFTISFAYRDPKKARDTIRILITRFQEANLTQQRAPANLQGQRTAGENLDVLDPPSLPTHPAKPNHYFFASLGFGSGFMAALILVIFRRPVRPAISVPAQPA